MLRPEGGERVLDLACGIGRHSMQLRRRGFEVVGVDISGGLLEMAERSAGADGLDVSFVRADLRQLDFEDKFDLVLSLNDGAVGYFETDEESRRTCCRNPGSSASRRSNSATFTGTPRIANRRLDRADPLRRGLREV